MVIYFLPFLDVHLLVIIKGFFSLQLFAFLYFKHNSKKTKMFRFYFDEIKDRYRVIEKELCHKKSRFL